MQKLLHHAVQLQSSLCKFLIIRNEFNFNMVQQPFTNIVLIPETLNTVN